MYLLPQHIRTKEASRGIEMNAKEKAAILKQAGYFYTTSNFASTKHRWYQGEGEALSASPWIAAGETFAAATNATYGLYLQAKSATPATVVKAIEHPADILREKNALIASQAAEIARKTELLKRIYALPYIKDIAISILIEDELGMNDPENSPKFAEHFKRQAPAPTEAPATVTLSEEEIEWLAGDSTKLGLPWQYKKLKAIKVSKTSKVWQLRDEFDTLANRAAIAARRKALGLA
jgi:hypothetical protein